MTSTMVNHHKLRKTESRKSHSWWFDSHVSPKNSRWLQENLEEMDQNVKRMLKLIEEDADSFGKKAEMYYKKRPELINHVEDFYRMYRSLAERYDHVTGELRKNIPSDLRSQGSGISDISSELPSTCASPPDQRLSRRRSGPPRAAGFDFFHAKEEESSTLDSECESDDSSVNNYVAIANGDEDQGLRLRNIELEAEIREVKEKYRLLEEEISEGGYGESKGENAQLMARLAGYEEDLKVAREKIRLSEGEINRLKDELQRYRSLDLKGKDFNYMEANLEVNKEIVPGLQLSRRDSDVAADSNNQTLEEELSITKAKLLTSEGEVAHLSKQLQSNKSAVQKLQDQLGSAQKDISSLKAKHEREKREVSKLQDRIARYKSNLADRDQEIRGLREAISNSNKTLSEENSQLQADVVQLLKEKAYLEDNIKEMDLRCQSLDEDVRRIKAGKADMEALFGAEIEAKNKHIEDLNRRLVEFELRYNALLTEKNELEVQVTAYVAEIKDINQIRMEAIDSAESTCKELRCRVRELEQKVERQQEAILERAEEKREAIRQLCFSIEHYRNGYHSLRKAIIGHTRPAVMAS